MPARPASGAPPSLVDPRYLAFVADLEVSKEAIHEDASAARSRTLPHVFHSLWQRTGLPYDSALSLFGLPSFRFWN